MIFRPKIRNVNVGNAPSSKTHNMRSVMRFNVNIISYIVFDSNKFYEVGGKLDKDFNPWIDYCSQCVLIEFKTNQVAISTSSVVGKILEIFAKVIK